MIRRAKPEEAGFLTDLTMRSKAHWGYDAAFMKACREELTITPDRIRDRHLFVFDGGEGPLGLYELLYQGALILPDGNDSELHLMFVDPEAMGRGVGKALWRHMESRARILGIQRILIDSDPQAQGFYEAMGARQIGWSRSASIPGRQLPNLEKRL